MAKKQVTTNKNIVAKPAVQPRTPRVTTAKHTKATVIEPAAENPHAAISRIAYGYWASRGYQGGNAHEDWVHAEHEYFSRR